MFLKELEWLEEESIFSLLAWLGNANIQFQGKDEIVWAQTLMTFSAKDFRNNVH